jgi:hypothetical protein
MQAVVEAGQTPVRVLVEQAQVEAVMARLHQ